VTEVEMRVGVAVPAAGAGRRMGGVRKAFLELGGEPVLVHALRPFLERDEVVAVAVALSPRDAAEPPAWLTGLDPRVNVVAGGRTRTESVRNAVRALPPAVTLVAVHDGARPLVSGEVVARCFEVAAGGEGAVAGCPAVDTLKRTGEDGVVEATVDRRRFWHAHTPQVFPAGLVFHAYGEAGTDATDDAALVERSGAPVRMVDGGRWNLKVTRPEDLPVAEALLRLRRDGSR
jgi:2-C-methyl-D-erythritol 4-phosphate cytidylyltransferase